MNWKIVYHKIITSFYFLLIVCLILYSYVLIDPNITFINHSAWNNFRSILIPIGYYRRDLSFYLYGFLISLLFLSHFYFLKHHKKAFLNRIILIVSILTLVSYPLLTHDFFNYLFDAKIFTFYHKNPYVFRALDFPHDPWLRFMHWVHRPYPYGPIFLIVTIIPSFLSFGKFVLSFFFLKTIYVFFYVMSVLLLKKMNRKWAFFYATHPLIIIEGLVNAHNDFISLSFAIIGLYFVLKRKNVFYGFIGLLFSAGIKYITIPLLLLSKNIRAHSSVIIFALQIGVIIVISMKGEIQPWYFLALFAFIPFFEKLLSQLNVFFAGLLFSYYPYIRFGAWDSVEKIQLKHNIIIIFAIINLIYLIFIFVRKKSLIK